MSLCARVCVYNMFRLEIESSNLLSRFLFMEIYFFIIIIFITGKDEVNIKYLDPSYMIRSVPADAGDSLYCMLLAQNAVHGAMAGSYFYFRN